jgi:hypothetical protein
MIGRGVTGKCSANNSHGSHTLATAGHDHLQAEPWFQLLNANNDALKHL